MEKENKNLLEVLKKSSKQTKIILLVAASLLLATIICIIIFLPSGKTTYSVNTSLKVFIESSELSTSEYTYNSIAKVKIDPKKSADEDNVKYQIAYKGTVKSGFNFEKIEILEESNSIIVIIPKIEIQSIAIDANLEYIFVKEKYDTETTYAEAYNVCYEDLESKAKNNETLYNTAIESAIETLTAITKPFEQQLDGEKTIKVVYTDNYYLEI